MLKKILLLLLLSVLAYVFYYDSNIKIIAAGVSIFLFGMFFLEEGFKTFSGGVLEKILKKSTDKLYKSLTFGIVATSIMQSSSLVSVLTISFLGAGLISLAQGVGIIFGANLGTTTGAWLVAGLGLKVKISSYAMPMLVFGIILIFTKSKTLKGIGYVLSGIGFLFLGIHYMKEGFEAFKASIDLSNYSISGIKGLFIFSGIGIFATVVMQSSHATLVLIITALAANQISYENALALAIGANVGTTITAIIGSLSSNLEGKKLAAAHFIFNIITGLVAIIFIKQLVFLVDYSSSFIGIESDDYTLKLALFHTYFNLVGILLIIPFTNKLVIFLNTSIKYSEKKEGILVKDTTKYINDSVLEFPQTALVSLIKESKHLYDNTFDIITQGLNIPKNKLISSMPIEEVINEAHKKNKIDINKLYNYKIKTIYGEILDFSIKAQSKISQEDMQLLYKIRLATRDMVEAIKDTESIQKNLKKYSNSPNKYIKNEYDNIRKNLAELLRKINTIATTNEEDIIILLLSKTKLSIEKYDIINDGVLDNLIRKNLITNEMATSLMNDSAYSYNISKKLVSMAEVIFIFTNENIKEIASDLIVEDNDIDKILKKEI